CCGRVARMTATPRRSTPSERSALSAWAWPRTLLVGSAAVTFWMRTSGHPRCRKTVSERSFAHATDEIPVGRLAGHAENVDAVWWAGRDLNPRRHCRLVYSQIPLATRAPTRRGS